jgi:hypothetical protein
MALIAAAFFKNEMLCKIGNTVSYHFLPTETQPDDFFVSNRHRFINGEITGNYTVLGGKTGYTNAARQTLVTCAEKDGMRLVCVIMKEETPDQFTDTALLFDYGFSNFEIVNIAENESRYVIENASFFQTGNDIFGDSSPLLSLNRNDILVMPKTTNFESLDSNLIYIQGRGAAIAEITYSFSGITMGTATIDYASSNRSTYEFDSQIPVEFEDVPKPEEGDNVVFVNVKQVIFMTACVAVAVVLFFVIRAVIKNHNDDRRRRMRNRIAKRKRKREKFKGYYI